MQIQIHEANAKVVKEHEWAQKDIEEAPSAVQERPLIIMDSEKYETLTDEM